MATDVIKSIGAGKDYADLAAFGAALPGSLVSADQRWIAEVYGSLSVTSVQTIPARTTDATRNVVVRPAVGQGFADNAGKLTNPLFFDGSKGAAISVNAGYSNIFEFLAPYTEIRGMQLASTNADGYILMSLAAFCKVVGNILNTASTGISVQAGGGNTLIRRNLIRRTATGMHVNFDYGDTSVAEGNTIVGGGGYAVYAEFSGCRATNNVIVRGSGTPFPSTLNSLSSYNATDAATLTVGSNNLAALVESTLFESTSDFRIKAGAAIASSGLVISGDTLDILGQTVSGAPSRGSMELASGGGGASSPVSKIFQLLGA